MNYESRLYHHGIKGQKWGVRNGPPYPIDSDKKSLQEVGYRNVSEAKQSQQGNRESAAIYVNRFSGKDVARVIGTAGAVSIGMMWTIGFMRGKV